jgi:hypothetical protein
MKIQIRPIIYIFIFTFLFIKSNCLTASNGLPKEFQLIPYPTKVEVLNGTGLIPQELHSIQLKNLTNQPLLPDILSILIETTPKKTGVLILEITKQNDIPESLQGYVLQIENKIVNIRSRGKAGLFYGCQTLQQLLEDSRDTGIPIPALKITDYPALSYRSVHWDVKHHLDKMHYYYNSIDRLARYKINGIIFEVEDKLRYRRQPEIGAPQAISIEEMQALTEYARDRFIEITPLVQGLGHATFILKHDKYKHLRELPDNRWAFCPMDEGTYNVLFDMYLDAIEATPGARYLHIGGDEVGNIGLCHRCKDYAEKNGNLALNLYWLTKVCEFSVKQGRTPIFWDDMPFKYANLWNSVERGQNDSESKTEKIWAKNEPILNKLLDMFPKQAVYHRWIYGTTRYPGNIRALKWYRDSGLTTMVATSTQTTTELMPGFDRVGYIKEFLELAAEYEIDGMLCTAWDDSSPIMEMYWRGFIASAEYSWSPRKRELNQYEMAFYQREFGPETQLFYNLYADLYEAAKFWQKAMFPQGTRRSRQNFLQNFSGLEHWIKPQDQEKKEEINYEERLIGLPDLNKPGNWSKKHRMLLNEAKEQLDLYKNTASKIEQLLRISRRNRYFWRVMQAMNNFQITTAKLILGLQKCDTKDKTKFKLGIASINSIKSEFHESWNHLKKVYGEVRFIEYPKNYVKDRYFHFASQKEDLSFMIQAEDLFYNKIDNWVKKIKL